MAKRKDLVFKEDEKEITIPKYKQKSMLDHGMILLGVIFAAVVFLVIYDLFYEGSLLGLMFSKDQWDVVSQFYTKGVVGVEGGAQVETPLIYDNTLQIFRGWWFPSIIYTFIFLVCVVAFILLVIRYIRDYVEVVKGLFAALKQVKTGAETSFMEAIAPREYTVKKSKVVSGSDSKFFEEADKTTMKIIETLTEEEPVKKKGRPRKKRDEEEFLSDILPTESKEVDPEEEMLNKMLSGETEPEEMPSVDYTPKSLFSDKD